MSDKRLIAFRFPAALVLSIVCLAAPAWADFKAGEKAYQRKTTPRRCVNGTLWQSKDRPPRNIISACSMPMARASQKMTRKHDSGMRKPPIKNTRLPRSIWQACMIMVVVVCRISRWRRDGIFEPPIKAII